MNLSLSKSERLFLEQKYKGEPINIKKRIKDMNQMIHKNLIQSNRTKKTKRKETMLEELYNS